ALSFSGEANVCVMKGDFGPLASVQGSVAGRIVQTVELTPSLERKRQAELNFFSPAYLDEARALIGGVKHRFDPADGSYQALRDAGGGAYPAGHYDQAADDFCQALATPPRNPRPSL